MPNVFDIADEGESREYVILVLDDQHPEIVMHALRPGGRERLWTISLSLSDAGRVVEWLEYRRPQGYILRLNGATLMRTDADGDLEFRLDTGNSRAGATHYLSYWIHPHEILDLIESLKNLLNQHDTSILSRD